MKHLPSRQIVGGFEVVCLGDGVRVDIPVFTGNGVNRISSCNGVVRGVVQESSLPKEGVACLGDFQIETDGYQRAGAQAVEIEKFAYIYIEASGDAEGEFTFLQ